MNEKLVKVLDLKPYLDELRGFLARDKQLFLQADINLCLKYIEELSKLDLKSPPLVQNLDKALVHLSKGGVLHLELSLLLVKIITYFLYLKKQALLPNLTTWLDKIIIPDTVMQCLGYFNEKGELREDLDERLININSLIKSKKSLLYESFKSLLKSQSEYLMDEQIHYINDTECLLLRGGYKLKCRVVARSSGGGFFVSPKSVDSIQDELSSLKDQKEAIYYEYAQKISQVFQKELSFLKFINKGFDLFDNLYARVLMAKKYELEFIKTQPSKDIILKDFAHPILKNPKTISLSFTKKVLLITGVNAGGKSMLLKGIMSACLMAKYLFPMRINAKHSKLGHFKNLDCILQDPQDVKNDISTFTGRMAHFSTLFGKKELLLGVDEIELGTDASEAACLYGVLVKELIKQDIKIIITTHHKKLAQFLSTSKDVELLAALYDEEKARPSFSFLQGTIGKSYAFESASKYINSVYISKARELYYQENKGLEELLNKNIALELSLRQKIEQNAKKEQKLELLIQNAKEQKQIQDESFKSRSLKLEHEYYLAINEAKNIIKLNDKKDQQRALNKASKLQKSITLSKPVSKEAIKLGDFVKYEKIKGQVVKLGKNDALIKTDTLSIRAALSSLKKINPPPKQKQSPSFSIKPSSKMTIKLDLHGLRVEEALDKLEIFISDALLAGHDEVLVYHGIGTGALAKAVKQSLSSHPRVKSFCDAPLRMGGYGAKLISL